MSISQLDLLLLGGRALTSRLSGLESDVRGLAFGTAGFGGSGSSIEPVRPNLLTNSSFEYFHRGSTTAQDWAFTSGATLFTAALDADGTTVARLAGGASVSQAVAQGATLTQGAIAVSVAAKASVVGQSITVTVSHVPGRQLGPVFRLDLSGAVTQSAEVPADGQWHRFFVQALLVGGGSVTVGIQNAGSGSVDVDAVKVEHQPQTTAFITPTAYQGSDWGGSSAMRDFRAENIVAGTLTVGGASSNNPRITVLNSAGSELVTIDQNGVEVKGSGGMKVTGTGSMRVLGGGNVEVSGGGGVKVTGTGNVEVSDGGSMKVLGSGKLMAGTEGGARTEVQADGIRSYNASNAEQVHLGGTDGRLKVKAAGGVEVSGGGSVTVLDGGEVVVSGTGRFRAGPSSGYHAELGAGGLALFDSAGDQSILLSSVTGKLHVFDDSVQLEDGGKLSFVSGLAWGDNKGLWVLDASGHAAFGVSGVDGHAWGNLPGGTLLDKGDVLLGNTDSYVRWDASASKLIISGTADGGGFTAGAGAVRLDADGLSLRPYFVPPVAPPGYDPAPLQSQATLKWRYGGATVGQIYGEINTGFHQRLALGVLGTANHQGELFLTAGGQAGTASAGIGIYGKRTGTFAHEGHIDFSGAYARFTGKLGVGMAPDAALDVVAPTSAYNSEVGGIRLSVEGTPAKRLYMGWDATFDGGYVQAVQNGVTYKPLALNPAGGNVAIGQAVYPNRRLTINDVTNTYIGLNIGSVEKWAIGTEGAASNRLVIYSNGGSGYAAIFDYATGYLGLGGAPSYRIDLPNTASAAGQGRANAWVTYSSLIWKDNVETADPQRWREKVMAVRAVEYDHKEAVGGGRSLGFIAEEVLRVEPELVTGDPEKPETLALDYGRMAALMWPVVQELVREVEALKDELRRIKTA